MIKMLLPRKTLPQKTRCMQFKLDLKTYQIKSFDSLIIHYHNYDRKYNEQGTVNNYYSESITAKSERDITINDKLSYGYGAEYKYDWGEYTTLNIYLSNKRTS